MPTYKPVETFSHANKSLAQLLEDHKKWIRGPGGQRADLRGAALRGADMRGVNLMGANLREADLEGASLNRADLRGADLANARLDRAGMIKSRLVGSNLQFASLIETISTGADFTEANLIRADLRKASLNHAVLRGANLREADLREANLVSADLRDSSLLAAEMTESILSGADLSGANLRGSRLVGANLLGVDLSRADLHGADLRKARLDDSLLDGSNLTRADLTGAALNGACLDGADLSEWGIRGTSCARLFLSEAGEVVSFDAGEFEKKCFQPEELLDFSLSIPLTVATAYLAKFMTQAVNAAMGSHVVSLRGLVALSTHETKIVMVCLDGAFHDKALRVKKDRLEKALNDYFQSHPLKKDFVYLGEMLAGSANGSIDFGSCSWMRDAPWQVNPAMIKEEILEAYRKIGGTCKALNSLISSVIGDGNPGR